ncbi:hypothetical protein F8M41_020311 [Gigaspora margarita]|uniref:Peptidase S1 domain-containing protein n=1 Tax=Gigaspora margarita TaxID=4874 RepID=A0A8H4AIR2_GIGMA|nr:hypothetical protein F8M41_020311 [Gigaspora margarita]
MKLNNVAIRYYEDYAEINRKFLRAARDVEPTPIFVVLSTDTPFTPHTRCISQTQTLSGQTSSGQTSSGQASSGSIIKRTLNGDGIYNEADASVCSLGFWARDNENEILNYLVTAGHCFNDSVSASLQKFDYFPWELQRPYYFLGEMVESDYNISTYDFALINITGRDVGQTTIIRNTDSEKYKELIIEGSNIITSYGAHFCKSGLSSHVTCGYVKGLGAVTAYLKEGEIRENLIYYGQDNFKISCEGDSGGSAFSYLRDLSIVGLNGIHTGAMEDFSESLPLIEILREGELEFVRAQ